MYLFALTPRENITSVLVEAISMIGILIFGISITYTTNKGDDGIDYVSRMTALTFPVTVKLFILSLFFGILIVIANEMASLSEQLIDWAFVIFTVVIQMAFFWRINVHLKYINA